MAKDNEQTAAIQADDPAAAFQAAHEAEVAALLQRPPMTPAQAREMLGIKDRRGR